MKIRLDFVTNSSSSSFVSFTIDNKVLYNLVRKCRIKGMSTARQTIQCSTFNINDRPVLPFECKTSLADWLVDFFNKLELTSMDMTSEARDELVKEIKSKKDVINAATSAYSLTSANMVSDGWGTALATEDLSDGNLYSFFIDDNEWNSLDREETLYDLLIEEKFAKIKRLSRKKEGV